VPPWLLQLLLVLMLTVMAVVAASSRSRASNLSQPTCLGRCLLPGTSRLGQAGTIIEQQLVAFPWPRTPFFTVAAAHCP